MASVTIRDIEKSFGSVNVLNGVSIDIEDGEFIVLVGPSGCGKSTLLRIIAGLEQQNGGNISIEDELVDNLHASHRDIAMVFQSYALYPHLTVASNIRVPLLMRRLSFLQRLPLLGRFMPGHKEIMDGIKRDVDEVTKTLGIGALMDRKPGQLSGGQRQRVAIARAMVLQPQFVVLDEPTSALDVSVQAQIVDLLRDLQQRHRLAYLFISHDLKVVRALADEVIVLRNGKVMEQGKAAQIFDDPQTAYTKALMAAAFDLQAIEDGAVSN